uniref:Uncharacterized protein n=1 Tax=Anguilla anguilla TaxID=7936 RepID=A0A0E9VQA6_ANGAN
MEHGLLNATWSTLNTCSAKHFPVLTINLKD